MKENGCGLCVRRAGSVVLVASLALAVGCAEGPKGGERLQVYPVDGEVFVDGQPAEGAVVTLQPVTPLDLPEGSKPVGCTGQVDATGKFKISTYSDGDGAPAGEFGVSVIWIEMVGLSKSGDDRLQGRYANPANSEIPEVNVVDGPVTIPKIDLKMN